MTSAKKPGWMREQMPKVAAMVDDYRAQYGDAHVAAAVRAGMAGQASQFYAIEGGMVVGAPFNDDMLMGAVAEAFMVAGAAMVMRVPAEDRPMPGEVTPPVHRLRAIPGLPSQK